MCPTHGVITEAVPWAEHESRFTRDFEDLRRTQARDRKGSDEATVLKGARWALL